MAELSLTHLYRPARQEFLATLPVNLSFDLYPMGHEISPAALQSVTRWLTAQLEAPVR